MWWWWGGSVWVHQERDKSRRVRTALLEEMQLSVGLVLLAEQEKRIRLRTKEEEKEISGDQSGS